MSILRTHSNAARQSEDDPTVTGSNKAADLRARFGQSAETPKTEPPRAPETEIEPAVTPRAASPTVMSGATMPALFEGGYDLPPTRVSGTMLQGDRIAVEGAPIVLNRRRPIVGVAGSISLGDLAGQGGPKQSSHG